uniref:Protein kinase domain-containing protein n=1 Tax=Alexandrium monilatum TaxID=311494 RepID=A0A7S4UJM5_9DINO
MSPSLAAAPRSLTLRTPNPQGDLGGPPGQAEGPDEGKCIKQMKLCYAAASGDAGELRRLLKSGADANMRDFDERSALHVAASHGQLECVKALLEHRADPNAPDLGGVTPLSAAQRHGFRAVEKELALAGGHMSQAVLANKAKQENWFIRPEEVKIGDLLSETFKSQVFKGEWMGSQVVVKLPKVYGKEEAAREDVNNKDLESELIHEIELLSSVRHPDLVLFLGACLQDEAVMFVIEYVEGGDLERFYMRKRRESGDVFKANIRQQLRWASAVARALSFLHGCRNRIIHRDLKPLNLLMTRDLKDIKVTDFGISKVTYRPGQRSSQRRLSLNSNEPYMMTGGVGSWRYMAPEVVRHEKYNEKADIFSFGLILFFMSSGMDPFHEMAEEDGMLKEYLKGNEPRPGTGECHKKLRDVMSAAWHVDSKQRPSAAEMVTMLADVTMDTKCACMSW